MVAYYDPNLETLEWYLFLIRSHRVRSGIFFSPTERARCKNGEKKARDHLALLALRESLHVHVLLLAASGAECLPPRLNCLNESFSRQEFRGPLGLKIVYSSECSTSGADTRPRFVCWCAQQADHALNVLDLACRIAKVVATALSEDFAIRHGQRGDPGSERFHKLWCALCAEDLNGLCSMRGTGRVRHASISWQAS